MTSSLVMRHKRSPHHCGDPVEAERLRSPFLAWVRKSGFKSNVAAFRSLGINLNHGASWIGGKNLSDQHQRTIRMAMGDAAGAP